MGTVDHSLTVRGSVLQPHPTEPRMVLREDALLEMDSLGTLLAVRDAEPGCPVPETRPGALWLPGFVDTHLHYPQTRMVGSASGPLLDWLNKTTFPEEARFADDAYAQAVADEFCHALVHHGTTTAAIFSSPHPSATHHLFSALDRYGLRGMTGLTLMDRNAPPENLLEAEAALDACEALIETWHGHDRDRLRFCVTPRFAISCTPTLLRGAGDLAARLGLPIQTHLSENSDEIDFTASLFPESVDYVGVYADHGLLNDRTVMAHCIHLSEREWVAMATAGAAIAHCPDSNFFLGSGCMRLAEAGRRGIRVGIGTDVGGGRSFSVRRCAARAYDASCIVGEPTTAEALLWHATRGGAQVLGLTESVGLIEPGFEADLVAVARPDVRSDLFDGLLFQLDYDGVLETRVRGRALLRDERPFSAVD